MKRLCLIATVFLFAGLFTGCSEDSKEVQADGTVDVQLIGAWNCIERSVEGRPTTNDLESLYLDMQQEGSWVKSDGNSGRLEWGAEDGEFINFIGFPVANRMEYTFPAVNVLTLSFNPDTAVVKYRFSHVDS